MKRQGQFPTGRGQQFMAQIAQTLVFIASHMLKMLQAVLQLNCPHVVITLIMMK